MTSRHDVTSEGPVVDLVYTWVDGDDAQLQADIRQCASGSKHLNPERMRDPYDLLRYSLRSADMFAPWIRKVHIITRRPQVPRWLDLSNPRLNVVRHDELRDFGPYLPTFNSTAIESFVHAVPGLSDHFLSGLFPISALPEMRTGVRSWTRSSNSKRSRASFRPCSNG